MIFERNGEKSCGERHPFCYLRVCKPAYRRQVQTLKPVAGQNESDEILASLPLAPKQRQTACKRLHHATLRDSIRETEERLAETPAGGGCGRKGRDKTIKNWGFEG